MNSLSRFYINEGMCAGIPAPSTRERTITLYLDKDRFRKEMDIPGEETICFLLVDQKENIPWHEEGEFTRTKGESLRRALHDLEAMHPVDIRRNPDLEKELWTTPA